MATLITNAAGSSGVLDACYLSAGDDDEAPTAVAELRTVLSWLVGSAP